MKRRILNVLARALPLALAAALAGCESGSDPIGAGHDFGDNDANLYLALGDSITRGSKGDGANAYPAFLASILGKSVINAGVGGDQTGNALSRLSGLMSRHKPGFVLILLGANDIIFTRSDAHILGNLQAIIGAAKARGAIPVIATLTPTYDGHGFMAGRIAQFNPRIVDLAASEGIRVVRLDEAFGSDRSLIQSDGLHPTTAGNERMAIAFANVL